MSSSDPLRPTAVELSAPPAQPPAYQSLSVAELMRLFATGFNPATPLASSGLAASSLAALRAAHGFNALTPPVRLPWIMRYLKHYWNPFLVFLNVAGVLSCVAYALDKTVPLNLYLGLVLFGVTVLSASFAFWEESKSTALMASFKHLISKQSTVIRDGREQVIDARELLPGDIMHLQTGDQVPADGRLLVCRGLKVECAALTGEALAVECNDQQTNEANILECRNMVFSSCHCLEGEAFAVVTAIGDATFIGDVHRLTNKTKLQQTTLQVEIIRCVKLISLFSLIQAVVFFVIGMSRGLPFISTFINAFILVMVANVPQGLPSTVLSCLAIIAKRLSEQHVFVKDLQAMETLGAIGVLATDKTGTITQNKMTVAHIAIDGRLINKDTIMNNVPAFQCACLVDGPLPSTASAQPLDASLLPCERSVACLELVAAVVNRTRFQDEREMDDNQVKAHIKCAVHLQAAQERSLTWSHSTLGRAFNTQILADATRTLLHQEGADGALFAFLRERQSVEALRSSYPVLTQLPFNSTNKFAISVVRGPRSSASARVYCLMKGAPEVVLAKCDSVMMEGRECVLDDEERKSMERHYELMANEGERVLGFAIRRWAEYDDISKDGKEVKIDSIPLNGYCFVGLVGLIDPPKAGVAEAIATCRRAGIKVVMITGDHPLTGASIARQVNLLTRPTAADIAADPLAFAQGQVAEARVVVGAELRSFSDADWQKCLSYSELVFARISPAQKLEIVERMQAAGQLVAVTGDGVNDAPCLKRADIGIAMGISGSDVAREAAGIILLDDEFGSIVSAIREGRCLFDNLTKTIAYTLSHLWPEVVPILLNLAFSYPLAIGPLQILSIDLGTELAPAIALAYEPPEDDVLSRPPRKVKSERLVTWNMLGYSYCQIGVIHTMLGLLAFWLVMDSYGFSPTALTWSALDYWADGADTIITKDGRIYNDAQQLDILAEAQTAYWATLVFGQCAHIFTSRTRCSPIGWSNIFANLHVNIGVLIEMAIIFLLIFAPGVQYFFSTLPFSSHFCWLPILNMAAIACFNEARKAAVRQWPKNKYIQMMKY